MQSGDRNNSELSRRTVLAATLASSSLLGAVACNNTAENRITMPSTLHGADLSGADPQVRPQDDLYRHVNGKWLKTVQIPADQLGIGVFTELHEENLQKLRHILDSITTVSGDYYKAKTLYDSARNTDELDAKRLGNIEPLWKMIDQAHTNDDMTSVAGKLMWQYNFRFPLMFYVDQDPKDSQHCVFLTDYNFLMLEQKYFRDRQFVQIRADYREYLRTIYEYAKLPDPDGLAHRVLSFDQQIARKFPREDVVVDENKAYHQYSLDTFQKIMPGLSLAKFVSGMGVDPHAFDRIIVDYPHYYAAFAQLWSQQDVNFQAQWLKAKVLEQNIDYLPQRFRDAQFAFRSKVFGITQQKPRWRFAVETVTDNLPDAVGQLYVAKYFPRQTQQQVKTLIDNIIHAYRKSFEQSWLSSATKAAAIAKLDAMTEMVGYPDHWQSFEEIQINQNFYQNMLNISRWRQKQQLAELVKPNGKLLRTSPVPVVDATYNPWYNKIYIYAGICQAPFFDPTAEPAVNYGAIGMVIGHEISHGFDADGSQRDAHGNIHNWWTKADRERYDALTQQLIAQYNTAVPAGLSADHHVNGALTVCENAADIVGLTIAIRALRAHYNNGDIHGPLDKTILHTAFDSYARSWREKLTPQAAANGMQTTSVGHSPAEIRANQVVKNIDDFYEAFDVKPGDKEYLPPEQRVKFW